ncbi:hypothetical protein KM043_001124 [Ampulex compressa]|nr:hypothetical protein KM043_001124 [Ampulex compressa]
MEKSLFLGNFQHFKARPQVFADRREPRVIAKPLKQPSEQHKHPSTISEVPFNPEKLLKQQHQTPQPKKTPKTTAPNPFNTKKHLNQQHQVPQQTTDTLPHARQPPNPHSASRNDNEERHIQSFDTKTRWRRQQNSFSSPSLRKIEASAPRMAVTRLVSPNCWPRLKGSGGQNPGGNPVSNAQQPSQVASLILRNEPKKRTPGRSGLRTYPKVQAGSALGWSKEVAERRSIVNPIGLEIKRGWRHGSSNSSRSAKRR